MSNEKQLIVQILVGIFKAGKDLIQLSRTLSTEVFGIILWLVFFCPVVYKQQTTKGNIPRGDSVSNDGFDNNL
jgi:hypothetical protein